jgi:hypothetical protein
VTILVLDCPGGPPAPYAEWLADADRDVVLFTGRPLVEMARCDTRAYASVHCFEEYETSALVELAAVRLAAATAVSAVVAAGPSDAIRAGALRELLDVEGQGRDDAIALSDLVALRLRLERAGVPVLAAEPVQRVADLYWHRHRWGAAIGVRRRREPGWPLVTELRDEAAVRAFACGGLSARLESVPSLVAEPCIAVARRELAVAVAEDGSWSLPAGEPQDVARAALAALAPLRPGGWRVELVRTSAGGWLVDAVSGAAVTLRALVREQAGLARPVPEAVP